jgi:ParB-like chromosome segregation protein Spo0J
MFTFSSETGAGVALAVRMRPVGELRPYAGNARTHSRRQVRQIADSITRFGFTNPVLTDDAGGIIAGHGRVAAAQLLGITEVPTIALSHLSPEERRAYVLADNKLAENAGWDRETLAIELQGLIDIGFDLELTGFSLAEIDFTLDAARERSSDGAGREDRLPAEVTGPAVTRPG